MRVVSNVSNSICSVLVLGAGATQRPGGAGGDGEQGGCRWEGEGRAGGKE